MSRTIIKNIEHLYSFDDLDRDYQDVDMLIEDGVIKDIGKELTYDECDQVINAKGLVALPGFVNTHHHLYQTLFRGIPSVQELPLFPWLKGLYEYWQHLDAKAVRSGAMVGLSELVRTGCTLTSDHHYVFPKNADTTLIDVQIEAAKEIGIRFHATRGSMSRGKDQGGLPPMSVVQKESAILDDSLRLIKTYHDADDYAMTRLALAPCSPFSVTEDLMRETAKVARDHKVMLHTHLAETRDEEAYCIKTHKLRPYELMESLNWIGEDVWFAHGIFFNPQEILKLKGCGIAHCPSSNMKLGSGICHTNDLLAAGVKVSIAVDGSASNDGSNMWEEVRRAYLLNHLKYQEKALPAREILRIATRGGAQVLGRRDTGYLALGQAADLNLFDLNGIEYAGCHDPLVAIVSLGNHSFPHTTMVAGKILAQNGNLMTIDLEKENAIARATATSMIKKYELTK